MYSKTTLLKVVNWISFFRTSLRTNEQQPALEYFSRIHYVWICTCPPLSPMHVYIVQDGKRRHHESILVNFINLIT